MLPLVILFPYEQAERIVDKKTAEQRAATSAIRAKHGWLS